MENESTQVNDQRSEEVCEFPKYIKKSKILTGFFFGDQLTEVRTGKSLNTTLTHTDENCKDPEVECTVEQIAIKADAAVDQNKYLDNTDRSKTLGKLPTPDRAWKSNDLCQKKCQDHLGRVNAYLAAVAGCHGDDRVDTVNIKEVA